MKKRFQYRQNRGFFFVCVKEPLLLPRLQGRFKIGRFGTSIAPLALNPLLATEPWTVF